jgi:hypothetical protein
MTVTREQAADCYTLAMTAHRHDVKPEEVRAWHTVLAASGIDGDAAVQATVRLCSRPGQFPPTPGDVVAEAQGVDAPPSVEAAMGHFLAGTWDAHPAVEAAARNVWWDRVNAPDQAMRQFRQLYAAALDGEAARHRKASEPAHISEAMRKPLAADTRKALEAGGQP